MKIKMVARVLIYKLGSSSYGNSKLGKIYEDDCLAIFKRGLWQTGFFRCGKEWYQQLMVSKTIDNYVLTWIRNVLVNILPILGMVT